MARCCHRKDRTALAHYLLRTKFLPAEFYAPFLSDAAKMRRPSPSKFLPTRVIFPRTDITHSSWTVSARGDARLDFLARREAKRHDLPAHVDPAHRAIPDRSERRDRHRGQRRGPRGGTAVRPDGWDSVAHRVGVRPAGAGARAQEGRRLEGQHWIGLAGCHLQGGLLPLALFAARRLNAHLPGGCGVI